MKFQHEARCIDVECKRIWKMLAKLSKGSAELRVEMSRCSGLQRQVRICKQCTLGEVQDEVHFALKCEALSIERRNLLSQMQLLDVWQYGEEGAKHSNIEY